MSTGVRATLFGTSRVEPVTAVNAVRWAAERLRPHRGDAARLEATYLVAGCLGLGLSEVGLRPDRALEDREWEELQRRVERRLAGEPLQYIEGRAAFREFSLKVDRRVLVPRPETEVLVEHVLAWAAGRHDLVALDVGTGCGAIALSLVLEGPFERVVAVDISRAALNVAEENARAAGCVSRIEFRHGSLFDPVRPGERFDAIVSNPPYLAWHERANLAPEVREWEPAEALFAGPTGLEVLEVLTAGASRYLTPRGLLALEVAPGQARIVAERLARDARYVRVQIRQDLAGLDRVVLAEQDDVGD